MQIAYGQSRTVVMIGGLVFKFPRNEIFLVLKRIFKRDGEASRVDGIRRAAEYFWYWFLSGIKENLSEAQCWRKVRASFLAPTYFTVGFMNIQRRVDGEKTSWEEMLPLWEQLLRDARKYSFRINRHTLRPENIRRTYQGYIFVDYGDRHGYGKEVGLTLFFTRWKPELERVFAAGEQKG